MFRYVGGRAHTSSLSTCHQSATPIHKLFCSNTATGMQHNSHCNISVTTVCLCNAFLCNANNAYGESPALNIFGLWPIKAKQWLFHNPLSQVSLIYQSRANLNKRGMCPPQTVWFKIFKLLNFPSKTKPRLQTMNNLFFPIVLIISNINLVTHRATKNNK